MVDVNASEETGKKRKGSFAIQGRRGNALEKKIEGSAPASAVRCSHGKFTKSTVLFGRGRECLLVRERGGSIKGGVNPGEEGGRRGVFLQASERRRNVGSGGGGRKIDLKLKGRNAA